MLFGAAGVNKLTDVGVDPCGDAADAPAGLAPRNAAGLQGDGLAGWFTLLLVGAGSAVLSWGLVGGLNTGGGGGKRDW